MKETSEFWHGLSCPVIGTQTTGLEFTRVNKLSPLRFRCCGELVHGRRIVERSPSDVLDPPSPIDTRSPISTMVHIPHPLKLAFEVMDGGLAAYVADILTKLMGRRDSMGDRALDEQINRLFAEIDAWVGHQRLTEHLGDEAYREAVMEKEMPR